MFVICVSMHHAVVLARICATNALAAVLILLRARVSAEGTGSRGAATGARDKRHTCPETPWLSAQARVRLKMCGRIAWIRKVWALPRYAIAP
jgi:hypothetical protein